MQWLKYKHKEVSQGAIVLVERSHLVIIAKLMENYDRKNFQKLLIVLKIPVVYA